MASSDGRKSVAEHVSVAGLERKTERSGPKIEWAGAERGAGVMERERRGEQTK